MDKFNSTLILCSLITIVQAMTTGTPTITNITKDQIRDIGDQVNLECSAQNAQDYRVVWIRYDPAKSSDELPLSINTAMIVPDRRFSVRFDEVSSSFILSIRNIQESDAGFYKCQIMVSDSNRITAETKLEVKKPL